MLDYHILHTVSNGIAAFKSSQAQFRILFNDVSQDYADKLFNKINTVNVNFNSAYMKSNEKYPLITTLLSENSSDNIQPLGNRGFNNQKVLLLNQRVQINIYANDQDIIRILHRIVQASLLNFKQNFIEIGYINLDFITSTEVLPNADYNSKDVITFERNLIYNAQKQLVINPINGSEDTEVFWATVPTVVENNQ